MAITINQLSLDLANLISDNKTDANALITAHTDNGQQFTSAQRLALINQSTVELYSVIYKVAETVNLDKKFYLLEAYITSTSFTPSTNIETITSLAVDDILAVIGVDKFVKFVPSNILNLTEMSILNQCWSKYKKTGNWTLIVRGMSGIVLDRVTVTAPAGNQAYGNNALVKDAHKNLLLDIMCKNAYIAINDTEKISLYNQQIVSKFQLL